MRIGVEVSVLQMLMKGGSMLEYQLEFDRRDGMPRRESSRHMLDNSADGIRKGSHFS